MNKMTTILRSRNDILKIFNQNPLCLRHFVPTMGSLHEGHISLIRKAKKQKGKIRQRKLETENIEPLLGFEKCSP